MGDGMYISPCVYAMRVFRLCVHMCMCCVRVGCRRMSVRHCPAAAQLRSRSIISQFPINPQGWKGGVHSSENKRDAREG